MIEESRCKSTSKDLRFFKPGKALENLTIVGFLTNIAKIFGILSV